MNLWFKKDVYFFRDPKVLALPDDTAIVAFDVVIAAAKILRTRGVFESRAHLEAWMPTRYQGSIDALIKVGLLGKRREKLVINNFEKWQVDPTAHERKARWLERQREGKERFQNGSERSKSKSESKRESSIKKELDARATNGGMKSAFEIILGGEG
jgi:hypothetical protein